VSVHPQGVERGVRTHWIMVGTCEKNANTGLREGEVDFTGKV